MNNYDFELIFKLPSNKQNASIYLDSLFEYGCDDATVSMGQLGIISLSFSRESISAKEAIQSAIKDVQGAIPQAKLVEASPDIVSLTDVASILGYSRQYVRKLFEKESDSFTPIPIHVGNPSIWHLSEVLTWMFDTKKVKNENVNSSLFEIASITKDVNLNKQLIN